jgi:hypothetical protein
MALRMHTNPVLTHLIRRAAWPSLRLTLGLTLGLGVVYSFLSAYGWGALGGTILDPILSLMAGLGDLFLLLAPLVAGLMTVIATVRFLRSDAYTALCTTPLASGLIARGLILSALYRVRLLLALMIVLSAGEMAFDLSARRILWNMTNPPCDVFLSPDEYHAVELAGGRSYYGHHELCVAPPDPRMDLLDALRDLVTPVVRWGVTVLAVVGGVAVSLAWRRKLWGVLFSFVMTVTAVLSVVAFDRYLAGTWAQISPRNDPVLALAAVWPAQKLLSSLLVAVAIPYLLALCIVWLTSRLARKPA